MYLYSFFGHKFSGRKPLYSDKDFAKTSLQAAEEFFNRSFHYGYLRDVSGAYAWRRSSSSSYVLKQLTA